jgi:predicted  nucleic acid-binding Zn-ribbon protein
MNDQFRVQEMRKQMATIQNEINQLVATAQKEGKALPDEVERLQKRLRALKRMVAGIMNKV